MGMQTGGGMGGETMPAQPGGSADMQAVMQFFAQTVQALKQSGLSDEQAVTMAIQEVQKKFGQEAATQLMMAAQQANPGGPVAEGPGNYGPAAPGAQGQMPV